MSGRAVGDFWMDVHTDRVYLCDFQAEHDHVFSSCRWFPVWPWRSLIRTTAKVHGLAMKWTLQKRGARLRQETAIEYLGDLCEGA